MDIQNNNSANLDQLEQELEVVAKMGQTGQQFLNQDENNPLSNEEIDHDEFRSSKAGQESIQQLQDGDGEQDDEQESNDGAGLLELMDFKPKRQKTSHDVHGGGAFDTNLTPKDQKKFDPQNIEPDTHQEVEIAYIMASRKRDETDRELEVKREIPTFIKSNSIVNRMQKSLGLLLAPATDGKKKHSFSQQAQALWKKAGSPEQKIDTSFKTKYSNQLSIISDEEPADASNMRMMANKTLQPSRHQPKFVDSLEKKISNVNEVDHQSDVLQISKVVPMGRANYLRRMETQLKRSHSELHHVVPMYEDIHSKKFQAEYQHINTPEEMYDHLEAHFLNATAQYQIKEDRIEVMPVEDEVLAQIDAKFEKMVMFDQIDKKVLFKDMRICQTMKNIKTVVSTAQKVTVTSNDDGKKSDYYLKTLKVFADYKDRYKLDKEVVVEVYQPEVNSYGHQQTHFSQNQQFLYYFKRKPGDTKKKGETEKGTQLVLQKLNLDTTEEYVVKNKMNCMFIIPEEQPCQNIISKPFGSLYVLYFLIITKGKNKRDTNAIQTRRVSFFNLNIAMKCIAKLEDDDEQCAAYFLIDAYKKAAVVQSGYETKAAYKQMLQKQAMNDGILTSDKLDTIQKDDPLQTVTEFMDKTTSSEGSFLETIYVLLQPYKRRQTIQIRWLNDLEKPFFEFQQYHPKDYKRDYYRMINSFFYNIQLDPENFLGMKVNHLRDLDDEHSLELFKESLLAERKAPIKMTVKYNFVALDEMLYHISCFPKLGEDFVKRMEHDKIEQRIRQILKSTSLNNKDKIKSNQSKFMSNTGFKGNCHMDVFGNETHCYFINEKYNHEVQKVRVEMPIRNEHEEGKLTEFYFYFLVGTYSKNVVSEEHNYFNIIPLFPIFDWPANIHKDKAHKEQNHLYWHSLTDQICKKLSLKDIHSLKDIQYETIIQEKICHSFSEEINNQIFYRKGLTSYLDKFCNPKEESIKIIATDALQNSLLYMYDQKDSAIEMIKFNSFNEIAQSVYEPEAITKLLEVKMMMDDSHLSEKRICQLQQLIVAACTFEHQKVQPVLYLNKEFMYFVCSLNVIYQFQVENGHTTIVEFAKLSLKERETNNFFYMEMPDSQYGKMKIQDLKPNKKSNVKILCWKMVVDGYLFLLQYRGFNFMVKYGKRQVITLKDTREPILRENTTVYFIEVLEDEASPNYDSCTSDITYVIKSSQWYDFLHDIDKKFNTTRLDGDVSTKTGVIFEIFQDNKSEGRFGFPLIVYNITDNYLKQNLTMVFIDAVKMVIKDCQSVNPMRANLKDLDCENIKLLASSKLYELFGKLVINYSVAFYFKDQGGRFKIDEYKLVINSHFSDHEFDQVTVEERTAAVQSAFDYSNYTMKLSGITELISTNPQNQVNGFQYYYFLPLFGHYGKEKMGTQILNKVGLGENMIVINIFANLWQPAKSFKYKTQLVTCGSKRVYVESLSTQKEIFNKLRENIVQRMFQSQVISDENNNFSLPDEDDEDSIEQISRELNSGCYYQMLRVQIRREFSVQNTEFFDEYESHTLLKDMCGNMLDMIPYDFERDILHEVSEQQMVDTFLDSLEVLHGKSFCDLYLRRPAKIRNFIKQQANSQKNHAAKRTIDHLVGNDTKRAAKFREVQLLRYHHNISQDFNYLSQIQRAELIQQPKSTEVILQSIKNLITSGGSEDGDFNNQIQSMMMQMLPATLNHKLEKSFMVSFFNRSYNENDETDTKDDCKFEQQLIDEDLPLFAKLEDETFMVNKFWDFRNFKQELKRKINYCVDPYAWKPNKEDVTAFSPVYYSYIDLRQIVYEVKLGKIHKKKFDQIKYDNYALAKLIDKALDKNPEIAEQDTIENIIKFHFFKCGTYHYFTIQLLVQVIGFLIPSQFLITTSISFEWEISCFIIAYVAQCYLFLHEVTLMIMQGRKYLSNNYWNWCDLAMFFIFTGLFTKRAQDKFQPRNTQTMMQSPVEILLFQICICLAMIKILFLLRIYDELSFLVYMVLTCARRMLVFLIFLSFFIVLFANLMRIAELSTSSQYVDVPSYFCYIIQVLRSTIGAAILPDYSEWLKIKDNDTLKSFGITLAWAIWIVMIYFNQIIIKNFLINLVRHIYVEIQKHQTRHSQIQKSNLNREFFLVRKFWGTLQEFRALVFVVKKDKLEDKIYQAQQDAAKESQKEEYMEEKIKTLESKVDVMQEGLKSEMSTLLQEIRAMRNDFHAASDDLKKLKTVASISNKN